MISNEIKAKIYSQYLPYFIGTPAALAICQVIENYIIAGINNKKLQDHRIELKSLSAISDEDAIQLIKISCINGGEHRILINGKIETENGITSIPHIFGGAHYTDYINERSISLHVGQYLQSRGYALGYMNYTVEDLVKLNVYKIIE